MCVLAAYDPTNLVGLNHAGSRGSSSVASPVADAPVFSNVTNGNSSAPVDPPIVEAPSDPPIAAPVDPASLDPIPVYTTRNYILDIVDLICLIIYTFEFIFKAIVMGAFLHKGSYLRNGWNVLDFVIVVLRCVLKSG